MTKIGNYMFHGCNGLTSVSIPDSVTSIGKLAFFVCEGITRVDIGNSVTSIGDQAFMGCIGLMSLTIPDSVTNIGEYAFFYCSGLTSVYIGDSVTSIGGRTFEDCNGLKMLSVPGAWEGTEMLDDVWGPYGKPSECVVVYRSSDAFPPAQNEAEVAAALERAADERLRERIQSVTEYDAFRAWVTTNELDAGTVMTSTNAWISYALGTEGLFENEPKIVLGGVSVARPEAKGEGHGVALEVVVTVSDGENEVAVDADKVADMFEAPSNPCDWTAKTRADATPMGSENLTMKFKVQPPGEMAQKAFLRTAP